jgi:hypothetical protein
MIAQARNGLGMWWWYRERLPESTARRPNAVRYQEIEQLLVAYGLILQVDFPPALKGQAVDLQDQGFPRRAPGPAVVLSAA